VSVIGSAVDVVVSIVDVDAVVDADVDDVDAAGPVPHPARRSARPAITEVVGRRRDAAARWR